MKIALMLRAFGEKGGIGVYTRNVTRELLDLDDRNEYLLLYADPAFLGTHSHRPRVTERALSAPHKLLWDQIAVPWACHREGVDIVFHTKFSVPLCAPCRTSMVLHGAGWFIPEIKHFWSLPQRSYARLSMPVYCRSAGLVLSVSDITTRVFSEKFGLPAGRVRTVYLAPGRQFAPVEDSESLERVRQRYALPSRYVLTVSGFDRGPRKNIRAILQAYQAIHKQVPHKLVVVGRDCHRFREVIDLEDITVWDDVVFPGWVEQEDLPAVYSAADLFLYPSRMEAFPIPLTEAMACGVPIVTSNVFGLAEVAGEACLQVNPDSVEEIASRALEVLTDSALRSELARQSRERGHEFSWDRCAAETLAALEELQPAGR